MPHLAKASKSTKTKPSNGEERLNWIRTTVFTIAPTAVETVSYGIPTFDVDGKHLVHAAAYERHLGLYPSPATIAYFSKELAPYVHAKGSVQFPHTARLPKTLIKRMIQFRWKAMQTDRASKSKSRS